MVKLLKNISPAFVVVTALFFGWGFISANNDPLLTALKAVFKLNWTEALLTQIVGLTANALVALPTAHLINRTGSTNSILIALLAMLSSCLMMQFDFFANEYALILVSIFMMAVGMSALQVASNPLIAALGHEDYSHFRLTLAQTFNSLGVVIGVHFGTRLLLSDDILSIKKDPLTGEVQQIIDGAQRQLALDAVSHGYLLIGIMIAFLALLIFAFKKKISAAAASLENAADQDVMAALRSKWAIFGAVAIGLYVGAEVSIASVMINFLGQKHILGLHLEQAGTFLANFYWGGALLGRLIGTALLTRVRAPMLLLICAASASLLCLVVIFTNGPIAAYSALFVGFFNSVMFPTIFTITLRRAKVSEASVSGLLCLAISGGAILTLLVGRLADIANLSVSFLIPMLAYVFIFVFANAAIKTSVKPIR